MKRLLIGGLIACSCLVSGSSAKADWNEFWANFERDRCRNEAWPNPYARADQYAVRQTFNMMVSRGWEQQLVFQHFHFDANSHELNELGEHKLRWLLSQAPAQRSQILIQQTHDQDINSARMIAIQTRAAALAGTAGHPEVTPSNARPYLMRGMVADSLAGAVLTTSSGVGQVQGAGGAAGGTGGAAAAPTN